MQLARLAVLQAVEIEDAKGRVAGRLHLGDEDAGAERVDRAAGQEVAVAVLHGDRL